MKKLLPLLILILLMSCGASFQSIETINRVSKSIVTVSWQDGDTGQRCTGMIVGITRVLTVEHCLSKNGEDMYVDGRVARVVKKNDAFGLLEIPVTDQSILQLEKDLPKAGTLVSNYGYAYGGDLVVLRRSVAGYNEGHLLLDGPTAPGMSGGPVLNEQGKIVGINQATNQVLTIACTSKEIKDFLDGK